MRQLPNHVKSLGLDLSDNNLRHAENLLWLTIAMKKIPDNLDSLELNLAIN